MVAIPTPRASCYHAAGIVLPRRGHLLPAAWASAEQQAGTACLLPELPLEHDADALRVEGAAGEVTVVGLIVHFEGYGAVAREQVGEVEVADEIGRIGVDVVAVAELPAEYQSRIEEPSA